MLLITEKADAASEAQAVLSLPFELRQKARLRANLEDGREVGLQLPRGRILRDGDKLLAQDGTVIRVAAAPESVSTVHCERGLLLARICYHLGNRHVPLQVSQSWCRYLHDHVLDDMVQQLGGSVTVEQALFEPEDGAYAQGGHSHHSHEHDNLDHEHGTHDHEHG